MLLKDGFGKAAMCYIGRVDLFGQIHFIAIGQILDSANADARRDVKRDIQSHKFDSVLFDEQKNIPIQ